VTASGLLPLPVQAAFVFRFPMFPAPHTPTPPQPTQAGDTSCVGEIHPGAAHAGTVGARKGKPGKARKQGRKVRRTLRFRISDPCNAH